MTAIPGCTLLAGDAGTILQRLPDGIAQTVVTSPPYFGLRDYKIPGQIGLEKTPDEYVAHLVGVFREVRRVLRDDGTVWLNLGDSYCTRSVQRADGMRTVIKNYAGTADLPTWKDYAKTGNARYSSTLKADGLKDKDLIGIPWRVAFALQADGWYLRSDIIWAKLNCMPESVRDRPTKSHEYVFLLSKQERYLYDAAAVREPAVTNDPRRPYTSQGAWELDGRPAEQRHGGKRRDSADFSQRRRRDVWFIASAPYKGAHFATFPPALVEPCVLAGSAAGDLVLDPFCGSGTTGQVALQHDRLFVGIDLNPAYLELARQRLAGLSVGVH